MSRNPLASKIAVPYARALYDYSVEQNVLHIITAKCLETTYTGKYFVSQRKDKDGNPLVILNTTRKDLYGVFFVNEDDHFGKFLTVLYKRNRLHLLPEICRTYLELVSKIASIKTVEVSTAFPFTTVQKLNLIKKLKELTNAREIRLVITVDLNLIGGFLIKLDSNIFDFIIKNQLENLAKKLDWSRGIENLEQWIEK
jgi:F-type H+-transporting ATPase subunit delta